MQQRNTFLCYLDIALVQISGEKIRKGRIKVVNTRPEKEAPNNQKQTTDSFRAILIFHVNAYRQRSLTDGLLTPRAVTAPLELSHSALLVSIWGALICQLLTWQKSNGSLETLMTSCVRASFPAYPKWYSVQFRAAMMRARVADDTRKYCNAAAP